MRDDRKPTVAVIGAGMAGITAARELTDAGYEVQVFEKSRGAGGRMSTRRRDEREFDHGAQFFTVREARFRSAVARWRKSGFVVNWNGSVVKLSNGSAIPHHPSNEWLVAVPRMSTLCRRLSEEIEVELNTPVAAIERLEDVWELRSADGSRRGPFDTVVITAPPQQAAQLLIDAPVMAKQVHSVEMLPCWAVMIAFSTELAVDWDAAFVEQSPLSWIARNSSKPNRPTEDSWVLHGAPGWSAEHVEEDRFRVGELLLDAFFETTGCARVEPVATIVHRWRYARSVQPLGVDCLYDAALRIGVCGDWCRGDRVEDAYLSGLGMGRSIVGYD